MHEKLWAVGIVAPRSEAERLAKIILDSESFEVEELEGFRRYDENPYDELLNVMKELYSAAGEFPKVDPYSLELPFVLDRESVDSFSKSILEKMKEIDREEQEIESEIAQIERESEAIAPLANLKIRLEELHKMRFLKARLCKIHPDYYPRLLASFENLPVCVFQTLSTDQALFFLSLYPPSIEDKVTEVFKSASAEVLELPNVMDYPADRLAFLNDRLKVLEYRKKELELRKRELFYENARFLKEYYSEIFVLKHVYDFMRKIGHTQEFVVLKGWVTPKGLKMLRNLEESGDILLFEDVKMKGPAPTLLRNPKFIRPFEMLTKMYGIPRSDEIDPTPIISFLFLFFYGMMFGDVGHGLVISLLAYLLFRKTKSDLWYIMSLAGISSAIFGFLYGSVFGFDVLKPLFARPMESIFLFLGLSIIIGAFLIVFGMVLNLINRIKRSEAKQVIFDPNGISGLGLYLTVITDIFWDMTYGKPLFPFPALIFLSLGFIFMMFLYEVIFGEGSLGERIVLGVFETFDKLIAFFSNTLSFIRLGAFAMNHAGLFIAFYTMAKMSSSPFGKFMALLLGNLLLIFLEGLVVFIQAIRLEFYEFFSKFYSGDGREFKPVTYNWEVK